jgi:hypothetical protein
VIIPEKARKARATVTPLFEGHGVKLEPIVLDIVVETK